MKIAITAASGQLGAAITQSVQQKVGEDQVIAVARTPEKVQQLGIEIRQGDYNQPEIMQKAFEGVDTVLLVSGNDFPELRIKQHIACIEAAKAAGVKKVVYTSIVGREKKNTFSDVIISNRETEKYLRASGLDWVIGRNSLYAEPDLDFVEYYLKTGKIVNSAGNGKCAYTTRDELAAAYTELITNEAHSQQTYFLGGNEAITQQELADIISEIYQRPVVFEDVEPEIYTRSSMERMGTYMGRIIGGIYEGIRQGAFNFMSDFEQIVGRPHITMREFYAKNKIDFE